jgi:hypothetical protein
MKAMSHWVIVGLRANDLKRNSSHEFIIENICTAFGVTKEQLKDKTRKQEVLFARKAAMFYLRLKTRLTLVQIGKLFKRHHSTVIHAEVSHRDAIKVPDYYFKCKEFAELCGCEFNYPEPPTVEKPEKKPFKIRNKKYRKKCPGCGGYKERDLFENNRCDYCNSASNGVVMNDIARHKERVTNG